jgi:hypothetical protein
MSEEEGEVSATSPRRELVLRILTPNNQIEGFSLSLRMENQDNTLRLFVFHGTSRDDAEQHWFMCEAIWSVKRIKYEVMKIVRLETTFRDRALTWYMKYNATALIGQARSLAKIKQNLLREFQKLKLESQCITKIKEIKQKQGETVWDYEQWFKILLDQLAFQIQDVQHREWFIEGLLPHIRVPLTQRKVMNQSKVTHTNNMKKCNQRLLEKATPKIWDQKRLAVTMESISLA